MREAKKIKPKMFHMLILLFTLLDTKNTVIGGPTGQYFITTPVNSTVNSGQHVRLPCSVGSIAGSCQWTRDGFALGTDRNLAGYSRYLMAGDREEVCDLSIDPVLPIDEGVYVCQVSGGYGVAPISSAPVTLTVNSEPGRPFIVQAMADRVMEVKEAEEVELQCESQGGRPPAEIQWWDGEGRRIVSDVTEHVMRMEDRKTFKTVSTLKFKPSAGQKIKCSAHNDAFPKGKVSDSLEILFKGQPRVEVKSLEDGDSVKIFCNTNNPFEDTKFKWFINDVEIFDETRNYLEIQQFSKSYDKSRVKCSVKDEVVRVVELLYKKTVQVPKALPKSFKDIMMNDDESASRKGKKLPKSVGKKKQTMFTCIMEEDTAVEPKYVWIDGKLKNMSPDKTIEATDKNGKYKCKVIPRGMKKMNKMSKDLKNISRTFKKMSRVLNDITSPTDSN